jgi:TPP-dependent pyruvate/acetoin dehydrogenase alpha subunit
MNKHLPTVGKRGSDLVAFYRDMLRIRAVEEGIAARYGEQKMRCPVHLSIGQEAVAVGVSAALEPGDQAVSTHRCHAHYIAKGGDIVAMLAELMGKATGCCGGRGGSMHLFDLNAGMLLSLPIVAASIPVGVGAAFAFKQEKKPNVAVIYLGDASLEEGVYHESANFAALKKLPAIFVCENNLYSVYTNLAERQPPRPLTELGRAHGMPTAHVDGNDVHAVYQATVAAVTRARAGDGPTFILADTYRWREHCGPNYDNDIGYRTVAEFNDWRERDPIALLRAELIAADLLDDAADNVMKAEFNREVTQAFATAEAAPLPDPSLAGTGLYA